MRERNSYMERWSSQEALANLAVERVYSDANQDQAPDDTNWRLGVNILEGGFPVAAESVCWLSANSRDENIRFKASKYIIDTIVQIKMLERKQDDPLYEFMRQAQGLVDEHRKRD